MADLTARQKALINTTKAVAAHTQAQAKAEEAARTAPVTGTTTGYDEVTGDWMVETPDGGQLRAQSLSNASLANKRLAIQRFSDSQKTTVNTPPTDADGSWVVNELEALQRDVVALGAVQVKDRDPSGAADARYPGDKWLNNTTPALFIWDAAAQLWLETGGVEVQVLAAAPTTAPDTDQAIAFVRDPKEIYVWDTTIATPAWLGPYGGGGGGGFDGVFLSGYLSQFIPRNGSAIINWATGGLSEVRDTNNYFDSAQGARITLAASGIYRFTLNTAVPYATQSTSEETNWAVELRVKNPSATTVRNYYMSVNVISDRAIIDLLGSVVLNEPIMFEAPVANCYLEVFAVNECSATGPNFDFGGLANWSSATVEKVA